MNNKINKNGDPAEVKQISFRRLVMEALPEMWSFQLRVTIFMLLMLQLTGWLIDVIINSSGTAFTTANMKYFVLSWRMPVTVLLGGFLAFLFVTAEVFVQNPLNPYYPEKIYRTGDIVHYNERGELIYDGRKDFQIKHLGHRIELGEIETAAASLPPVKMACCLFDAAKDQIILCYVGDIAAKELREKLMSLVPEYMVPKRYEQLDLMPLNLNGKMDRVKLKEMLVKS